MINAFAAGFCLNSGVVAAIEGRNGMAGAMIALAVLNLFLAWGRA